MPGLSESRLLHHGGRSGGWGGLGAGDRVLGVAYGDGEELRLWVQEFCAGAVVGVERDALRVQRARAAASALPGVRVLHGSGAALPALGLHEAGLSDAQLQT